MTLIEIFLIGVGLSMDAFAVAICKGLSYSGVKTAAVSSDGSESVGAGSLAKSSGIRMALIPGFYFGLFQALPLQRDTAERPAERRRELHRRGGGKGLARQCVL